MGIRHPASCDEIPGMSLAAHARTIWPVVRRFAGAPAAPPSEPWSVLIADRGVGPVRLTGRLRVVPRSPRRGFDSPEDYYRRAGVGRRLDRLRVPALLVAAEDDPMLPPAAVQPGLKGTPEGFCLRWSRRGGHLAFPASLDLGEDAPAGLAGQVIAWLMRQ